MPLRSNSEDGKECGSRRSCHPSASIASRPSPYCPTAAMTDDISHACKLQAATARVLDWFRIGMRFATAALAARPSRSRRVHEAPSSNRRDSAKWLLWNGHKSLASMSSKLYDERPAGWERATRWLGCIRRRQGRFVCQHDRTVLSQHVAEGRAHEVTRLGDQHPFALEPLVHRTLHVQCGNGASLGLAALHCSVEYAQIRHRKELARPQTASSAVRWWREPRVT